MDDRLAVLILDASAPSDPTSGGWGRTGRGYGSRRVLGHEPTVKVPYSSLGGKVLGSAYDRVEWAYRSPYTCIMHYLGCVLPRL